MNKRRHTKLVREGPYYAAEVDVELIEAGDGWSPYLSVDDAYKLDAVREALRRGDIHAIGKAPRFCSASGRGKDSSSRMRTGGQQVSGKFESRDRLFTPHGGEIVEELIQGVTGGEVVEEVLHGHPSSAEDGRAAENRGVAVNDGIQRRHDVDPTPIE